MNKNLKKLLAVILVLVMALGSVAAATGPDEGKAPEPVPSAPSEPAPSAPVPSEPVPSEPVPSEPVPSEPVPSEPVPSEPVPSEPVPSEPAETVSSAPAALPVWQVLFGLRSSEAFEAKLAVLLPGEVIPAEDIEALKAMEDVNEFYTALRALLKKLSGGSEAALDSILLLTADADFTAAYGNIVPEVPDEGKSGETETLSPDGAAIVEKLLAAESMAAFDEIEAGLSEAELEAVAAYLAGQSEKAAALEEKIAQFRSVEDFIPFEPVTVNCTVAGPFMGAVRVESRPAPVRVKSYGLKNAAPTTFGNTEEDDGIELSKTVKDNEDGTYTVRLESYTTGNVRTEEKSIPMDVVLVLDQSGSMNESFPGADNRQAAMQKAVKDFIAAVDAKYSADADHRMALVEFRSEGRGNGAGYPVKDWLDVKDNKAELENAVDALEADGGTDIGAGLRVAEQLLAQGKTNYTGPNTQRQQVVIVFTDGAPGLYGFNIGYANSAIESAKRIKDSGATVYSVGIFSGADPGQLYGASSASASSVTAEQWGRDNDLWDDYSSWGSDYEGLNKFLSGIDNPTEGKVVTFEYRYWGKHTKDFIYHNGQWYVAIKSDFNTGGADPGQKDYWWEGSGLEVPASNRFMNYMSSNYAGATSVGLKGTTSWFDQNVYTRLTITESFPRTAPEGTNYYLTAENADALSNIFKSISEQISTPTIDLGSETIVRDTVTEHFNVPENLSGVKLYTADYKGGGIWDSDAAAEGLSAQFTGKTLTVTGFDYAENFMSENPKPDGSRGKKLIVEFEITPIEGFIGGNSVITNGSDSGIYKDAAAEAPLDTFPVPNVDVKIPQITLEDESADIYLGTPADLDSFINKKIEKLKPGEDRNDYVTIKYILTDPEGNTFSYTIPAGEAAGTWDGLPDGLVYGVDTDILYSMECRIIPTNSGTYGTQSAEATAKINVYKPEYSFKDSEIFLGAEIAPDYYETNNIKSGPLWKHGETPADESAMGPAPVLSLEFNPEAKSFKADTDVTVTVKLGERDITELTRKIPAEIKEGEKYHDFTVKVVSGTIIINKTTPGAAEDERFIFNIYDKEWKSYTVSVPANGSVEIHGLAEGSYIVDENVEWAWDYTSAMPGAQRLNKTNPVITFNITNNPNNSNIINDSTSVVNNSRKAEGK